MFSLSRRADIMCHSHAWPALQEHVTWDRCGGPRGPGAAAPGFSHIPLTDHGCKLTQVQNNSNTFLWLSLQSFPGPAGSTWTLTGMSCCSFHFSSPLNCPVNRSNRSDPLGGSFQMYKSMVRERRDGKYELKRQSHPAFTQR